MASAWRRGVAILSRPLSPVRLGVILVVAHTVIAHLFGLVYPLSPMGMFSESVNVDQAVVVRTAAGEILPIEAFADWSGCEDISFDFGSFPACPTKLGDGQYQNAADYIRQNVGPSDAGSPVTLLRRAYEIPETNGPVEIHECVLLGKCRARTRPRYGY